MPDDNQQATRLHNYAAETLDREIERFWKRSIFFWGFIAAAFIAYATLSDNRHTDKITPLAVACFGLVCSVAWTLANRGSKYWQWAWEQKLKDVEVASLGRAIFGEDRPNTNRDFWGGCRYSVTRLTIALSDFTVYVWIVLLYRATPAGRGETWDTLSILIAIGTVAFIACLLFGGLSRKRD